MNLAPRSKSSRLRTYRQFAGGRRKHPVHQCVRSQLFNYIYCQGKCVLALAFTLTIVRCSGRMPIVSFLPARLFDGRLKEGATLKVDWRPFAAGLLE